MKSRTFTLSPITMTQLPHKWKEKFIIKENSIKKLWTFLLFWQKNSVICFYKKPNSLPLKPCKSTKTWQKKNHYDEKKTFHSGSLVRVMNWLIYSSFFLSKCDIIIKFVQGCLNVFFSSLLFMNLKWFLNWPDEEKRKLRSFRMLYWWEWTKSISW